MIVRASALGMGVARVSRLLRCVGVLAMLDAELDSTRHIESACEIPSGACVLRLLLPGVVVRVFIDFRCVVERVDVMH